MDNVKLESKTAKIMKTKKLEIFVHHVFLDIA